MKRNDLLLGRLSTWVTVSVAILTLLFGSGWFQEYEKNQRANAEANQRLIDDYLQPIATLLQDNQTIYTDLSGPDYSEPGLGILESYLIKIRRDGVPKNTLMKNRIDTMVQNNETIITLLTKYSGDINKDEFRVESEKFRDHAIRYNDRWKSLIEIYASNGNFPSAPVFPAGFPKAVQDEILSRNANGKSKPL